MNTKHTPGPWKVYGTTHESTKHAFAVCDSRACRIAKIEEMPGQWTEEQHANARLIAAAPDLLEALKAFNIQEEWIVAGSANSLTLCVPLAVIQKAAAAIAKATETQ